MKIIESILTENSCYKIGEKMKVKGLMLHSIGCPQPRAEVFAKGWNNPTKEVAVHGFIDGNTGDVWQFLPWDICGWHAGGAANKTHIGVEMGEPDCIRYKFNSATFTVSAADKPAAIEVVKRTYASAVELFAELCRQFDLDPMEDGVIIGHAEGHTRGIASNHADPEHIWRQLGLNYTMDTFRKDVAVLLGKSAETDKSWDCEYPVRAGDTLSAIGARFNTSWVKLVELNSIVDPNLIYPGQILKISCKGLVDEEPYTVKSGDSLWGLAKKFFGSGWKYTEIMKRNGLKSSTIHPGDVLIVKSSQS